MKMLSRLQYLLEEGFEVSMLSGYDADVDADSDEAGTAKMTYIEVSEDGSRRLVTEEFLVTEQEMELCGRVFLESRRD